ncbi:hypothetical protein MMA231_01410 [Asticcacaulis sp. MM231]|uniref:dienelactone hydrolase family protein n=1 Tax=Asticcacaulis sp. MM231 TaxID=3157666 RepID=UPI0032D59CFC
MRVWALFVLLLGFPSVSAAGSNFTRLNTPGPHAVGLKVVEQYDYARSYRGTYDPLTGKPLTGEQARPIQTLIWYPASKAIKQAMTVGDYLKISASDDDFERTAAERAALESKSAADATSDLSPERAKAELAAMMQAHRDATPAPGKFPVVIYAPSFSASAIENADLCEYLASHGYVVIASPSVGPASRAMTEDLEGAETQAADIEFLMGYAHTLPQADTSHVAVAGYSWGGLANVLAAAKDSRINALVSLDGSARAYPNILKQAAYVTETRSTAPLLFVASPPADFEELPPIAPNYETSPLNHMKYADVYFVKLAPMDHWNFNTMFGQRLLGEKDYGEYSQTELSTATAWMETYVLRFLNAYLKDDAEGRAFLDLPAVKTGAPAHMLTTRVTHSQGMPLTRVAFAAELNRQGFDKASDVFKSFKTRDPAFTFTDEELLNWGHQMMEKGDLVAAIGLLRLDTEVHPDKWLAFDILGEAYSKHGDKDLAIAAYRQSLVLKPDNANAVERLKGLGV